MKLTILVPDIQHPYEDKLVMSKLIKVISDMQPDAIVQIGDGIDFPQMSKWTRGQKGEYADTLQQHIDGFKGLLTQIREAAPKARITWLEGNHDLRIQEYIRSQGPALGTLRALETGNLFGLKELAIEYLKGPLHIATNTYAVHGHESGGYAATPSAWDLKFIKRYGSDKSLVFGHTHQPFLSTRAIGFNGKVSPRFTMNVGSVMDPTHAHYVKDGSVSWTMSFGIIRDDGKRVYPELILATDRGFFLNGVKY
jgi:predicted phosphodiesterase